MYRRKIFYDTPRRKVFSSDHDIEYNEDGVKLRKVKCQDCGQELETTASPSRLICPRCGGKRFNIVIFPGKKDESDKKDRFNIFSDETYNREFNTPSSNFQSKLKRYSGETLSEGEFQKVFSDHPDMIEKGFANTSDSGVQISNSAYATEKMFSKLIISVTKILDLDPSVTEDTKEDFIDSLHDKLGDKGIILLRKAHGLDQPRLFSETTPEEQWLKDSSIIPDLKLEYGNQSMGIKQFMDILRDRYKDAPDNIIDLLTSKDVIRIEGNQVTISK